MRKVFSIRSAAQLTLNIIIILNKSPKNYIALFSKSKSCLKNDSDADTRKMHYRKWCCLFLKKALYYFYFNILISGLCCEVLLHKH